ncbi:MAG: hypothetical protein ACRECF_05420 [Methyloceanibacter sp.]
MTATPRDDQEEMTEGQLRLMLAGAARALGRYADSTALNFERDLPILQPVLQGIERLEALVDAEGETKQ